MEAFAPSPAKVKTRERNPEVKTLRKASKTEKSGYQVKTCQAKRLLVRQGFTTNRVRQSRKSW